MSNSSRSSSRRPKRNLDEALTVKSKAEARKLYEDLVEDFMSDLTGATERQFRRLVRRGIESHVQWFVKPKKVADRILGLFPW